MKPTELLKEQTNASETKLESGKLIDRLPIEGTPFTMIIQDEKYFVTIGNYKLTEYCLSYDEAIREIEYNKWNIIINLCTIIFDHNNKP